MYRFQVSERKKYFEKESLWGYSTQQCIGKRQESGLICREWYLISYSYLKYATLSARALRKVLKEDVKAVAMKREEYNVKMAKWTDGVPGEPVIVIFWSE